jgi:hypothetical protein
VIIPRFKNRKPVYEEFFKLWSSLEFKAKSEKKRQNRGKHRYGADGHDQSKRKQLPTFNLNQTNTTKL